MQLIDVADALEAVERLLDQNTKRCEALRKQLREAHESYEQHLAELEAQLSAVDAVPVVHGEWIWGDSVYSPRTCSVCKQKFYIGRGWNFCPNCGAKMDRKKKDDE